MIISEKTWNKYIASLRKINDKAAKDMLDFMHLNRDADGEWNRPETRQKIIDYGYGLATKYGEASASVSAEMYDAMAALQGATVPAAIPAETSAYSEVAKTVNGILKATGNEELVAQGIGRLVKLSGTDTILSNAYRDRRPSKRSVKMRHNGAKVAWIPSGDTCPYCIMLAGAGWRNQTNWGAAHHAEHVHANCDCTYAVKFSDDFTIAGYDPSEYSEMYEDADGGTREEKLNAMRREAYAENKEEINEQKRSAYEKRKERESSEAEEINVD